MGLITKFEFYYISNSKIKFLKIDINFYIVGSENKNSMTHLIKFLGKLKFAKCLVFFYLKYFYIVQKYDF